MARRIASDTPIDTFEDMWHDGLTNVSLFTRIGVVHARSNAGTRSIARRSIFCPGSRDGLIYSVPDRLFYKLMYYISVLYRWVFCKAEGLAAELWLTVEVVSSCLLP